MNAKTIFLSLVVLGSLFTLVGHASAGLIRHYRLESITSGITADATGNSIGTVNGTPGVASGILGNAFDFTGLDSQYVEFNDPFFGATNLTLSYWMSRDTSGRNDGPAGNWNPPSTSTTVLTRTTGNTLDTFLRRSDGAQTGGSTGLTVGTGFHNVVVTYDGTNFRSFVDGVEGTTAVFPLGLGQTVGVGSPLPFVIGGSGSSERNMDGLVDDLAMWNNTLDMGQVRSIHGLATTAALNYDAGNAQSLFNVFDETTASETISGKTWTKTGAGMLNGAPGDVVWLGGNDYGLVLDSEGRGVATKGGSLQSFQSYQIDIDSTDGGGGPIETAPGWVSLDASGASNSATVTVNGVTFQPFSAAGSRIRRSGGSPNPNALTSDFLFEDGANAAVGLLFGGAGDLVAGTWEVDVYIWDADFPNIGNMIVGYRENGSETIISSLVTADPTNPAITFSFVSDGVSAYDLFVRENNAGDRVRLNAVRLTLVPEPQAYALFAFGLIGLILMHIRRRKRADGAA